MSLKTTANIIILSVLVCFVSNNLLFTYSSQKQEKAVMVCSMDEEESCCTEDETEMMCCSKESCCARIPIQSSHLNFSVIIGSDEKNDALILANYFNTLQLSHLSTAAELSDGHLNSLIKPPAVAA